ncbi:MAG: hypothetical protein NTY02_01810 [Acidobacteria bacterium]|nr:hypothetical protein [Acidobacteriota bacterium]
MTDPAARALFSLALVAILLGAACSGPSVDVGKVVKVGNLTTGWFDAGIVDGKNKLVPSASFTVTNTGADALSALQVFSVFRLVGESEELGSSLIVLRGKDALGPSVTSKPITVRANWGFTGEQPRGQMLMHSMFKDARVEIFVKYGSAPFVKIREAQLTRQLLTH